MTYTQLLLGLAIDGAAITVLAYVVYFRRHRKADQFVAFVALNIGVFAAVTLLATQRTSLALGFGLFGILSIVRLRSSALTQSEVGYYFVALTVGLVNGLGYAHLPVAVTLDIVLVGIMYVLDRPRVGRGIAHRTIVLDVIHPDDASLRADLERRLGGEVRSWSVTEVDYVRDVMACEVQYRPRARDRELRAAR